MNKKVGELLKRWLDNGLINQETYEEIVNFEENSDPNQKSKVARAITLIGGLFLLSGLLGTIPLLWTNLAYWAQLGLLIATTYFLFYAAGYSEKIEDGKLFIFKSINIFPFFSYTSPWSILPVASEPLFGPVKPKQGIYVPSANPGKYLSFCSCVP